MAYPNGVIESVVPCSGHHNRYEIDSDGKSTKTIVIPREQRKCPEGKMLKQKIVDSGGDRCFKCFQHDHPHMNVGRHDPKDGERVYKGGSGKPGSKGSPPRKGQGNKKAKSA